MRDLPPPPDSASYLPLDAVANEYGSFQAIVLTEVDLSGSGPYGLTGPTEGVYTRRFLLPERTALEVYHRDEEKLIEAAVEFNDLRTGYGSRLKIVYNQMTPLLAHGVIARFEGTSTEPHNTVTFQSRKREGHTVSYTIAASKIMELAAEVVVDPANV